MTSKSRWTSENLILFGTPESNRVDRQLPLSPSSTRVVRRTRIRSSWHDLPRLHARGDKQSPTSFSTRVPRSARGTTARTRSRIPSLATGPSSIFPNHRGPNDRARSSKRDSSTSTGSFLTSSGRASPSDGPTLGTRRRSATSLHTSASPAARPGSLPACPAQRPDRPAPSSNDRARH